MTQFRWYQASVASFLVPAGMLEVLFPWLVAVYLAETPERVGLAQMLLLLPGLALLLVAGVIADRVDRRRMLIALHVINALPGIGLLAALWLDVMSYAAVVVFALASGIGRAFVDPALDAMLNRISGADLQRSVTVTVGMKYGTGLVGYLVAGSAGQVGIVATLLFYVVTLAGGVGPSARLPPAPPRRDQPRRALLAEVWDGIQTVLHSRRMLPPAVLAFLGGMFLGGPFAVLVPLLLREFYGGGSSDIASAYIAFMLGGATSTLWLLRVGGVSRPGRALLAGYVISGIALLIWSSHVPFWGFLAATTFWGFGGGLCHSMGRTIMQEAAPASHRARALSVYYLGSMGTSALGSLATGYLVAAVGTLQAALIAGAGTVTVCVAIMFLTHIWSDRSEPLAEWPVA